MKQYHDLARDILAVGVCRGDRTGTGTISLFGPQIEFDLRQGFPLLTTKKVPFGRVKGEILWFLSGSTNTSDLKYLSGQSLESKSIWDEWADHNGEVGPMYGKQLRKYELFQMDEMGNFNIINFDQLADLIKGIKEKPMSRRHVLTTWNINDLPDELVSPKINVAVGRMALAPCHGIAIQFYISGPYIDCKMYQRSCDVALGLPFNIAGYALLLHLIAQVTGHQARRLIITFGDVHIYENHITGMQELLTRNPEKYPLPKLILNKSIKEMDHFRIVDINLVNYESYPKIEFEVSV